MGFFDLTEWLLILSIGYFIGMILYVSKKLPKVIKTSEAFFEFGEFRDEKEILKKFEKTLTATNASFTTAFLGLFYMGMLNVYYALLFAIGYLLSFVVFPKYYLTKVYAYSKEGKYFPELLGEKSGSNLIRYFTSLAIVISLLLFLFTEIYGFSVNFLSAEVSFSSMNAFMIGGVILILLAWYVIIGGYQSVVITDHIQLGMITIGSLGLLVLVFLSHPLTYFSITNIGQIFSQDLETINLYLFVPAMLLGLLFSQLVYFDTWQRLVLFSRVIQKHNIEDSKIVKLISRKYYSSAINLLWLYLIPIIFAMISRSLGLSSFAELLLFFKEQSLLLGILVVVGTLTFVSALLSTSDTYLLSILQVFYNDFKRSNLPFYRRLVFILVLIIAPFILLQVNLGTWLAFLFYSMSGFIGPIILVTLGFKLNKYVFWLTMALSIPFIVLIYFYQYPFSAQYIDVANAIVVVFSISLNYLFRSK